MTWLIVIFLLIIMVQLGYLCDQFPEKPRAEWKNGKWNGVMETGDKPGGKWPL